MSRGSSSIDRSTGQPEHTEPLDAARGNGARGFGPAGRHGADLHQPEARLCTPAVQRVVEWHRQRSDGRARRPMGVQANLPLAQPPQGAPDTSEPLSDAGEDGQPCPSLRQAEREAAAGPVG